VRDEGERTMVRRARPVASPCERGIMKGAAFNLDLELSVLEEFHARISGRTVGVVYGALSKEDRLYLERAPRHVGFHAIMESLERLGLHPFQADPTAPSFLDDLGRADFLFLNVHGEYGEDGRLQGLLDFLGRPYTGSGVLPSAIALNKVVFKRVVKSAGILTPSDAIDIPPGRELDERAVATAHYPMIAKPVSGGSSIGIRLLPERTAAEEFLSDAEFLAEHGPFFFERFIRGLSLTVGVLELERSLVATPPIEARFGAAFYDERMKLDEQDEGLVTYRVCSLPAATESKLRETAIQVHQILGCTGFSRVDFLLGDSAGECYALEVNTIPGMASDSNFPAGTAALGLSYDQTMLAMLRSCMWTRRG
jgi:D-alanine-D-alanine ligase